MGPTWKRIAAFALLLAAGRPVRGEDAGGSEIHDPRQAAEAVVAAFRAHDAERLTTLASAPAGLAWIVLDEVLAMGQGDAAAAYAGAVPGAGERDRLRAHLAVWRDGALGPESRSSLRMADEAVNGGEARTARQHMAVVGIQPGESLFAVRAAVTRGQIAGLLRETSTAVQELGGAAEVALHLGWAEQAREALVLATTLAYGGDLLGDAERLLQRLYDVQVFLGDEVGRIRTIHDLGGVALARNDFAQAEDRMESALDAHRRRGDAMEAARCLGDLAVVSAETGRVLRALELLREADESMRATPATPVEDLAENEARLADVCVALGDHERAAKHFQEALELYRRGEHATDEVAVGAAMATANRGLLALETARSASAHEDPDPARFDEARKDLKTALGVFERLGADAQVANALLGLASVDQEEATQALASAESAAAGKDAAAAARWSATAGKHLGDASARLSAARARARANGLPGQAVQASLFLGGVRMLQKDVEGASEAYGAALKDASDLHLDQRYAEALVGLARVDLATGKREEAVERSLAALRELRRLVAGLPDAWRARAREHFADAFDVGFAAASALGDTSQACAFLEAARGAALIDAMRGRGVLARATLPEALAAKAEQARKRKAEAIEAYLTSRDTPVAKDLWKAYEAAREADKQVLDEIETWGAKASERLDPSAVVSLERLQALLAPDQAFVYYALPPGKAQALVVTRKAGRTVELADAATIRRAVLALAPDRSEEGDPRDARERLQRLLVDPLGLPDTTTQVLVSPESELAYVPFALLLPDRVDVGYVPSGTILRRLQEEDRLRPEEARGVIAAGDPDYGWASGRPVVALRWGGSLSPLPHTRAEVRAIATGPDDVALLGKDATEGRVRAVLSHPGPAGQTRWRALHLACHGLLDVERPYDSALALAPGDGEDGFLTVREIFRMQVPAELVVLSACETGKGPYVRGEGVIGLTRAFTYAGAPRVLVSLWKVDDAATTALMSAFHESWKPGTSAAHALRTAQVAVRDRKDANGVQKWKHPRYWAAWTLWGLPN